MEHLPEFIMNHWMLAGGFLLLSVLLINSFASGMLSGVASVDPTAAVQLINQKDAVVLDVRTQDEFKQGHILNAINIPVGLLDGRMNELQKHKESTVVVNCRSGQRSSQACGVLKKHGFTQVHNLAGGIMAWEKANLPLSKKG